MPAPSQIALVVARESRWQRADLENMRILVVDDEAKTTKFLKKGLGEAGFVVDVATNGLDGLQLAQDVDFDLVILDVMLPSLDGWQVLT